MHSMNNTLLLWNSKNHGLVVALQSVLALYVKQKIPAKKVILLQSDDFDELQLDELKIVKEKSRQTYSEILEKYEEERSRKRLTAVWELTKELKGEFEFKIQQKRLHISSVTDYQSIYNAVRTLLNALRSEQQLHVNVSPGTPQMHTVWLMLNTSGYLPANARIWSTQLDKKNNRHLLKEITFKPKAYLNEIFESSYVKSVDQIRINPNETQSEHRQIAEDKLQLFASIPDLPILILGERGVGKTTYVQQFIHQQFYSDYPFESIPCGIFSEQLIRSELFGYVKGAFSGADCDKEGVLHKFKENGLLFLDEIHDLSMKSQRELMQVLQDGQFRPIGGETASTNFRLLTASNLSFDELKKKLAPDFLDRIAHYIVEVPPIRDCREDIPLAFQRNWQSQFNDPNFPDVPELTQLFNEHSFYGNFRDLQKLAAYIYAYSKKHNTKMAIRLGIQEFKKWSTAPVSTADTYFQPHQTYKQIVNTFNKEITKQAIVFYGNRKEAIKQLNMSDAWFSKAVNGKSRS